MPQEQTILIADDNDLHCEFVSDMLQKYGYQNILRAKDAREAVLHAFAHKPDIILLDMDMPEGGGLQALKDIRPEFSAMQMPILVVSGLERRRYLSQAFMLGASDYFEKPIAPSLLSKRIDFHLKQSASYKELESVKSAMQMDVEIAIQCQKTCLPDKQNLRKEFLKRGVDIASFFQASTYLAGDLWGYKPLDEDHVLFYIFDVAGHGAGAALQGMHLYPVIDRILSHLCREHRNDYAGYGRMLLEKLNSYMCAHMRTSQFVTGCCGVINAQSHNISYAATSFPALPVLTTKGDVKSYAGHGLPLGVHERLFKPSLGDIHLEKGSVLLVASDGLSEAMPLESTLSLSQYGSFLPGEILLGNILRQKATLAQSESAQKILYSILNGFEAQNYNLNSDDITFLVLKRL